MQSEESLTPEDDLLAEADIAVSAYFIHTDRNHPLIKILFSLSKRRYIDNQQPQSSGDSS
ncbi:MAG: hypothetical protein JKY93_09820 [Gammaproteobacteria bacterium]|nr:hypothetical protein [Gammaproteobacteria bacterium]